ncbi:hypothetical protein PORCRE_816 [Porphyromonas crevioricanis JCM 15906]|uniref:Uncharacterized protein n=2 Tax=Porphyromonas crevioricanis TaxID=393921 RepID=A0A2X4PGQ5_9PORP|nr:hypothetical protein PORCRE_816 [Porphyromonas crevioricanis JCM 15906]SJZ84148.1 hypothetical protein SAMN02745203_01027 [Porphyromonas crevioricanis]SQH73076.1 Uncharacterised protein [Porphyromonas crevioricanis]
MCAASNFHYDGVHPETKSNRVSKYREETFLSEYTLNYTSKGEIKDSYHRHFTTYRGT